MAEAAKQPGARVLRLERWYAHARERVFAAWTEPEQLAQWWGPQGFSIPLYELDVREGGRWATTMRGPEGSEHHVAGEYLQVLPPSRLVFTWAWTSDGQRGHETTVTIEFHADGDGTRLVLTQQRFESDTARDLHGEGWESSLDCLSEHLNA